MSTTPGPRAATTAKRRSIPTNNYDHIRASRKSPKIGFMKAERLKVKNERRARHGLPPKASYAEI